MTTVAILPVESESGRSYQAISGRRIAEGETAGEALDALTSRFPEIGEDALLIVQRFRPDQFFSASQQRRLQELMTRWREARDQDRSLPLGEQAELEALVEAEVVAAGHRAQAALGDHP